LTDSIDTTGIGPDGRATWSTLSDAVGRAVIGADDALRLVAVALLADGHALIEDVPGIGKTLLARAVSRAVGLRTARIQGTPDLLPVDVTGGSIIEGGSLRFVEGPVFTNVLLVDEINRATPRTQSALLEAMQERQVSIEGVTRPLPEPFLVLATQNPIEYEGTFALPEAQLDRFLVRLRLGYPDRSQEQAIARRYRDDAEPLDRVPQVLDAPTVLRLRDHVRRLHVGEDVEGYVVAITAATRQHDQLQLGASPRASVALYRAAQAWAFLEGRDFVRPDDVKAVAPAVLAHRLVVDLDQGLRGATADGVLGDLLATVAVPPVLDAPDADAAVVVDTATSAALPSTSGDGASGRAAPDPASAAAADPAAAGPVAEPAVASRPHPMAIGDAPDGPPGAHDRYRRPADHG
jgi:MoxR-like ATPase